jgi:hypothetical protein
MANAGQVLQSNKRNRKEFKTEMQSKKAGSIMAGVFVLAVNVAYAKPKPKVEYNKVKDQTEASIPIEWIKKNRFGYDAGFNYPGKGPSRPDRVALRFVATRLLSNGDSLQWEKVDTIYFRYGDTKLNYPVRYDAKESNDTLTKGLFGRVVGETLICFVPADEFVPMSQAKELLFQIGDKSSTLTGGNIELLAALGKLIPPPPGEPAAPADDKKPDEKGDDKKPDDKKDEPAK